MVSNHYEFFKCSLFLTSDLRKFDFLRKKKLDDGTIIHIAINKFSNDTLISHLEDILWGKLPFLHVYKDVINNIFMTMDASFNKLDESQIQEKISSPFTDVNKTIRLVRLLVDIYNKGLEDRHRPYHGQYHPRFKDLISSAPAWLEANHTYIKSAGKH